MCYGHLCCLDSYQCGTLSLHVPPVTCVIFCRAYKVGCTRVASIHNGYEVRKVDSCFIALILGHHDLHLAAVLRPPVLPRLVSMRHTIAPRTTCDVCYILPRIQGGAAVLRPPVLPRLVSMQHTIASRTIRGVCCILPRIQGGVYTCSVHS